MRLLALEAGGTVLGAALFEGSRAVDSAFLRAPQRQTEQLAPLVDGLLRRQGWRAAELGAVACGLGPGSFTGLRSSLAFGRGLSLGVEGLRLAGVPTLAAWAEAFAPADVSRVRVLLDGRRGQVYRGLLERRGGAWADRIDAALISLEAARAEAVDGACLLSDLAEDALGLAPAPVDLESPALALAVGRLGAAALEAGTSPVDWEPRYLRRSEAELLWEKLHPPA